MTSRDILLDLILNSGVDLQEYAQEHPNLQRLMRDAKRELYELPTYDSSIQYEIWENSGEPLFTVS